MKSELRTELKSNLLADRLEEVVLAVKPHLKLIGFSLAALAAAGVIYGLMYSRNEKAAANAWADLYFAANRHEKLDDVSQDYPTTSAGLWAKQKSADALMARALEQVYVDRDLADKLLVEANGAYQAVLAKAKEPMLVCRATYGLAQVFDSQGNAAEAAREFKKVLTLSGAHSDIIADSQRRLQFIESDEGRHFYEWFKNNRPTAPKPVDIPKDLGNLPNQPDIQFGASSDPPAPSNDAAPPTESTSNNSGAALQMPPADADKAPVNNDSTEKSSIVEPPAAKPDSELAPSPPPLNPTVEEPEVPKNDEAIKIPDSEPAASEKKAGGS